MGILATNFIKKKLYCKCCGDEITKSDVDTGEVRKTREGLFCCNECIVDWVSDEATDEYDEYLNDFGEVKK